MAKEDGFPFICTIQESEGEGRERLFDIMALRVGAAGLGEGAYYTVGACLKKYRILLSSNEK